MVIATPMMLGAAAPDRDLEGVRRKIDSEKKGLAELKVKESSLRKSLGQIESDLGRRSREARAANAKLSSLAQALTVKKSQAEELERALADRRALLSQRAVALYRWQRSGGALALVNGAPSAASLMQRQHYFQTALVYDQRLAAELREASQRQVLVQLEMEQQLAELGHQKLALDAAKEAVRQEANKKRLVLAHLRREQSSRAHSLRQMEAAAERLARLLDQMARRPAAKPSEPALGPTAGGALEAMRGRLEWPVDGRVSAPFGKFKHPEFAAEIVRKGIDIEAPLGDTIRAVERGHVAYAGHFSGYGNMVIVDHGERYFTIYGHLSEILKKNGELVRRGEVLGKVGADDSWSGAKLYFEMRKDGRSVDPLGWLKKR